MSIRLDVCITQGHNSLVLQLRNSNKLTANKYLEQSKITKWSQLMLRYALHKKRNKIYFFLLKTPKRIVKRNINFDIFLLEPCSRIYIPKSQPPYWYAVNSFATPFVARMHHASKAKNNPTTLSKDKELSTITSELSGTAQHSTPPSSCLIGHHSKFETTESAARPEKRGPIHLG